MKIEAFFEVERLAVDNLTFTLRLDDFSVVVPLFCNLTRLLVKNLDFAEVILVLEVMFFSDHLLGSSFKYGLA